ncbi:hypothetical protein ACIP6Q_39175 [Streptomyces bobili]|uniref:hypothetical protein n=1 Tax=Streptomyces bobili TaxID=67280 RepID=UPI003819D7DF
MTPAEELSAAAFQLRNPFHGRGLKLPVDHQVADPLAGLLDRHAEFAALFADLWHAKTGGTAAESQYTAEIRSALVVARVINGEQQ